jgi:hypothetical protein
MENRKRNRGASGECLTRFIVIAVFGMLGAQAASADPAEVEEAAAAVAEEGAATEAAAAKKEKKWSFTIAPYVMLPFMTGSLTLANQQVDVNRNTNGADAAVLNTLDARNWGLMLYFEARHPKFSVIADLLYVNLGRGGVLPLSGRSAGLAMQQLRAEAMFLGRITNWLELGGGGRVNFVQADLKALAGMLLQPIDLDARTTWFDPLVVLRFSVPFKNDDWRLGLRGDVGGFTVGSTYAWQLYAYGGYNFDGIKDRRVFELALAFRAIGMRYETGSGLNRFVYDLIIYGPELGLLFHF